MTLGIAEIFADGAGGERSDELHGRRLGSGSYDDHGVVHGALVGEGFDFLRYCRTLLADGTVDADHIAAALVQNGIENDGGLSRLAVADDQFRGPGRWESWRR